ncbi:hypothetical protein VE03_02542 [Pseudogymnoascus sp. 23342-1-I1]|nr:hypothetical protein VE03_02542 [Pseudogymnoascus sp. 23342-1-I1]
MSFVLRRASEVHGCIQSMMPAGVLAGDAREPPGSPREPPGEPPGVNALEALYATGSTEHFRQR